MNVNSNNKIFRSFHKLLNAQNQIISFSRSCFRALILFLLVFFEQKIKDYQNTLTIFSKSYIIYLMDLKSKSIATELTPISPAARQQSILSAKWRLGLFKYNYTWISLFCQHTCVLFCLAAYGHGFSFHLQLNSPPKNRVSYTYLNNKSYAKTLLISWLAILTHCCQTSWNDCERTDDCMRIIATFIADERSDKPV